MKLKLITSLLLASSLLAACSGNSQDEGAPVKENKSADVKEMVNDFSARKLTAENASITSQQLIVTDKSGKETIYELPKDEFFVSIAPYNNETHPWSNHSLTGCQGELANEEFDVYIEDNDGNVVVDKTVTSLENGFIDFWLPRDKTYQIEITHDGKKAESEISTFENDATCITDMQLF